MTDTRNRAYNNICLKGFRRKLRNNMTSPEMIFWQKVRGKQISGLKFRRQYSIDSFIVDFFCPKLNLAIEIDGDSHYDGHRAQEDTIRDNCLAIKGVTVLRFTNDDIMRNIDGVLSKVSDTIPPPDPS